MKEQRHAQVDLVTQVHNLIPTILQPTPAVWRGLLLFQGPPKLWFHQMVMYFVSAASLISQKLFPGRTAWYPVPSATPRSEAQRKTTAHLPEAFRRAC